MENKKAIFISCFQWYSGRLEYIQTYLESKGWNVTIYMSDYDHIKKTSVNRISSCNYIHVHPYKKNLSFGRMYSHIGFSKKILDILKKEKPGLVIANLPPNSVAWACAKYKKLFKETRIVFDIIDMWPESYTAPRFFQTPFSLWKRLRDNNLPYADFIITECDLYQSFLDKRLSDKTASLYLCRKSSNFAETPIWDGKKLKICYLGSINNIIDISLIEKLLMEYTKSFDVSIHIIGNGEKKNNFISALEKTNCDVVDHGAIFDKDKIKSVLGSCHFAINIMKPSVCVGLTIKSLDYFQLGIPILNTIKGDTRGLISQYKCGFNIDDITESGSLMRILTEQDYIDMRLNAKNVFNDYFTVDAFVKRASSIFCNILY